MQNSSEILRKILHLIGGTSIPILIYLSSLFYDIKNILLSVIFIGIFVIIVNAIIEYLRFRGNKLAIYSLIEKIRRKEEEKFILGGIYYSFAVIIVAILVYYNLISFKAFVYCLIIFGICDGVSTISGTLFGKHKIFYNKNKSYEGSFSFFVFALIILFMFFGKIEKAIPVALFSAFVESLPKINDNFSVPIFTAIFIEVFTLI